MRYLLTLEQYDSQDSLQDIRHIINDILDEYDFTLIEYNDYSTEGENYKSYTYIISDEEFKSEFGSVPLLHLPDSQRTDHFERNRLTKRDKYLIVKLESIIDYNKRYKLNCREELETITKQIKNRLIDIGCEVSDRRGNNYHAHSHLLSYEMLIFIDYKNINL